MSAAPRPHLFVLNERDLENPRAGGAEVHLVLARDAATFDQSRGTTNGLSLMLCPRVLPDGTVNGVKVARVEQKMGIDGSPTCVIEFEHAEAFLLGKQGQGFRAMLDLMNNARLGVSAQAIGVALAGAVSFAMLATHCSISSRLTCCTR